MCLRLPALCAYARAHICMHFVLFVALQYTVVIVIICVLYWYLTGFIVFNMNYLGCIVLHCELPSDIWHLPQYSKSPQKCGQWLCATHLRSWLCKDLYCVKLPKVVVLDCEDSLCGPNSYSLLPFNLCRCSTWAVSLASTSLMTSVCIQTQLLWRSMPSSTSPSLWLLLCAQYSEC